MQNHLPAKLLAEFIGTFAFVFIGAGAGAVVGDGAGLNGIAAIAFAHGLTIMVFAFAYGSVSGGHMNPAVTVGVLAAGAIRVRDAAGYILSQLAGGIAGALLLRVVLGGAATGLGTPQLAHGSISRNEPVASSRLASPSSIGWLGTSQRKAAQQTSYSAAIRFPLTPSAIRLPTVWSMFRQYSIARASTGSVTPSRRWPTTLETSRSRWAPSMTLRTRVPA
jgi:Major intrinsic protein